MQGALPLFCPNRSVFVIPDNSLLHSETQVLLTDWPVGLFSHHVGFPGSFQIQSPLSGALSPDHLED